MLGALLPATNDPAADLAIFEKLMAIDDEAFLRREMIPSCLVLFKRLHSMGWMKEEEAKRLFVIRRRNPLDRKQEWATEAFEIDGINSLGTGRGAYVDWAKEISGRRGTPGNCAGFRVSTTWKGSELLSDQRK